MLDLGDQAIDLLVDGMQPAAHGRLAHHAPELARSLDGGLPGGVDVALVHYPAGYFRRKCLERGPGRVLIAVQQLVPHLAVMQFGGRGFQAVGDAAVGIDAKLLGQALLMASTLITLAHCDTAGWGHPRHQQSPSDTTVRDRRDHHGAVTIRLEAGASAERIIVIGSMGDLARWTLPIQCFILRANTLSNRLGRR